MKIELDEDDLFDLLLGFAKRKGFVLRKNKDGFTMHLCSNSEDGIRRRYWAEINIEEPKDVDPYRSLPTE